MLLVLKTMLGDFHAGEIIALTNGTIDAVGRHFRGEPLVASLRVVQKIAFDICVAKKTRERGMRTGPGRDAFIDLTRSTQPDERSVFSPAPAQVITKIAARMPPFVNVQLMQSVVDACTTFAHRTSRNTPDTRA